jgi:hypothetical protein
MKKTGNIHILAISALVLAIIGIVGAGNMLLLDASTKPVSTNPTQFAPEAISLPETKKGSGLLETYQQHKNETFNKLHYPNSTVLDSESNAVLLESDDSSDEVMDWYKKQIKIFELNVETLVETTVNGNVLNRVVGADGQQQIGVEIIKLNEEESVKIIVMVKDQLENKETY